MIASALRAASSVRFSEAPAGRLITGDQEAFVLVGQEARRRILENEEDAGGDYGEGDEAQRGHGDQPAHDRGVAVGRWNRWIASRAA